MKSDEGVVPNVVPSGCWWLKAVEVRWLSIKFFEWLWRSSRRCCWVLGWRHVESTGRYTRNLAAISGRSWLLVFGSGCYRRECRFGCGINSKGLNNG
jgi:hypothetical protein